MGIALLKQLLHSSKQGARETESGMTLLELLVVVIMVGILATTLGASWLGFTNRQRISRLNNAVQGAIEQAQIEAKTKKISYSVSFQQGGKRPEVRMGSGDWIPLGQGLDIGANQVEFTFPGTTTITFDYQGTVQTPTSLPLTLVVSEPSNSSTRKCVIIETLLGGIRTDSASGCDTIP